MLFYVLATSQVISARVPTCDSAHSWRFYSAASPGHWRHGLLSHCHIIPTLTQPGFEPAGLRVEPARFEFLNLPAWETDALLIRCI